MGLYAETYHVSIVQKLIEPLCDVLEGIRVTFDETGMYIFGMDTNEVFLLHARLPKDMFQKYECDQPRTIGINPSHLHGILEPLGPGYTIAFWNRDQGPPALGVIVENDLESIWFNYRIHAQVVEQMKVPFPEKEDMATVVTMRSDKFRRIVQVMNSKSSLVHVRVTSEQLEFTCQGRYTDVQSVVPKTDQELVYSRPCDTPIEGVYALRHLSALSKTFQLSDTVDLYFQPEFALVLRYGVGDTGDVRFGLSNYTIPAEET